MQATRIEWSDEVWNPVTGCTPAGKGCLNCYAKDMAVRLRGMGQPIWQNRSFSDVRFHPERLREPYPKVRAPRKVKTIFAVSMGDLFHPAVTDEQISEVLKVITHNTCHRFVLLTKRPARMWATFKDTPAPPNLYPGVSIEDSEALAERLYLPPQGQRQVVSFEPLLGPVDLWDATDCIQKSIQWVIVGAEQSRSAARPMRPQWAHSIRCWAHQTNTPYFFKKPSSGTTIAGDTLDREYPW